METGQQPQFHQNLQNDDQDEIAPCDSISNQGSVKDSMKSNVSSIASARFRAEGDMAALLAQQNMLNRKHALEEQEEQIRKQKERLQLKAEIATSMAKINLLRTSGSSVGRASSKKLVAWSLILRKDAISTQSLCTT